jgi:hypothetical protein
MAPREVEEHEENTRKLKTTRKKTISTRSQSAPTPISTKHLKLVIILKNLKLDMNFTKLGKGTCSKHVSSSKGNQEKGVERNLPLA